VALSAEARQLLEQRIAEMFFAVDSGQATKTLDFCTDDFCLSLGSTTVDRVQYAELMAKREQAEYQTRHAFSNPRVITEDGSQITIALLVTAHRLEANASEPKVNLGDFTDKWTYADDDWRLVSRSIQPALLIKAG
jgi:SnoaL-like domain